MIFQSTGQDKGKSKGKSNGKSKCKSQGIIIGKSKGQSNSFAARAGAIHLAAKDKSNVQQLLQEEERHRDASICPWESVPARHLPLQSMNGKFIALSGNSWNDLVAGQQRHLPFTQRICQFI